MKTVIAFAFVALCFALSVQASEEGLFLVDSTCKVDSDCPTINSIAMCCATFKTTDTNWKFCSAKTIVDTLGKDFSVGASKGTLTCGSSAAATLLIKFIVGLSIMTSLLV